MTPNDPTRKNPQIGQVSRDIPCGSIGWGVDTEPVIADGRGSSFPSGKIELSI